MNKTTWGKLGLICGALIFCIQAQAQQSQPVSTPQPNCILQFTFVAAGNSQVLDNRQVGCLNFTITASVPTTVTALSLLVQTAQDNGSASCSTCTWTTFTAATGANPIITFATGGGNATFTTTAGTTYHDFLRVQLTSVAPASLGTNHIFGKLYSSIAGGGGGGGGGGSGCAGTDATPCIVAGPDAPGTTPTQNPVLVAGNTGLGGALEILDVDALGGIVLGAATTPSLGFNPAVTTVGLSNGFSAAILAIPVGLDGTGSLYNSQYSCTLQGTLSSSTSGNQQLIAASGAFTIRICTIDFSTTIPENVSITSGTGANCGTGTATVKAITSAVAFDFEPGQLAPINGGAGNAVCINPANAQAFTVNFTFAQF